MKTLCILGNFAGGFLMSPPPRSAISALLWLGTRSHPVVTLLVTTAFLVAWRKDNG
ncbi:hypothetical protein ASD8599_03094 [Ascidiaceihabitans donghaensis]|uniref:Uncharacterized protein n=1 Tax=Ascidiaceihabitans donghaensis TaxID=1510460 RepID=A0A2R8BGT7_9RHOB|nr:hypothetical protein ASD8599_03094 [Ascidiaceihabitans donghaensis]